MSELSRLARRWRWNWFESARKYKRMRSTHLRSVRSTDPSDLAEPARTSTEPNAQTRRHVSLFDKCKRYTKAREVQAAGLYPYFRPISDSEDTVVVIEGQKRIMLGSNNYLGLTHHPKVLEAAETALRRYGSGCTGSRFLNGTLELHCKLENALAEFMGKESCLVFSTGYMANLGLISALVSRRDVVYLDKLDHASIVDGANLSFGEVDRFSHGDLDELERKLAQDPADRGQMIMVDGVYSMEGNIADLPGLLRLAHRYGAVLAVDDAHAIGVVGPNGNGTAAHFGLTDEVEIITGTFSKSLASIGGFVAADESIIHYLRHHSRPLIFSASLPPASTAGTLAALEIIREEPERRERLWKNTRILQEGFRQLGFDIGATATPIVPVLTGPLEKTFLFWRRLFDAGVFTNPVVPPAVPPAECRLRTSLMATHTDEQIDAALETFAKIGRELAVI
jgi:8-amino-7-oxononanoate synthase